MSAPRPVTILLILALVAVVALFAVALGARAPDDQPVNVAELRRRYLGSPRKVSVAEVKGDPCRGPLRPGQRCAFEVEGSWALFRTLDVRTQDEVRVVLSPSGRDRDVTVDLRPARAGNVKRVSLQVGREGAKVEITCRAPAIPSPGQCAVNVGLGAAG